MVPWTQAAAAIGGARGHSRCLPGVGRDGVRPVRDRGLWEMPACLGQLLGPWVCWQARTALETHRPPARGLPSRRRASLAAPLQCGWASCTWLRGKPPGCDAEPCKASSEASTQAPSAHPPGESIFTEALASLLAQVTWWAQPIVATRGLSGRLQAVTGCYRHWSRAALLAWVLREGAGAGKPPALPPPFPFSPGPPGPGWLSTTIAPQQWHQSPRSGRSLLIKN